MVDLSASVPSNFKDATACTVDADGDVFGLATDKTGTVHAVEWVAKGDADRKPPAPASRAVGGK
jgi:hypothetical protein